MSDSSKLSNPTTRIAGEDVARCAFRARNARRTPIVFRLFALNTAVGLVQCEKLRHCLLCGGGVLLARANQLRRYFKAGLEMRVAETLESAPAAH
jgi:hypothetical protein